MCRNKWSLAFFQKNNFTFYITASSESSQCSLSTLLGKVRQFGLLLLYFLLEISQRFTLLLLLPVNVVVFTVLFYAVKSLKKSFQCFE